MNPKPRVLSWGHQSVSLAKASLQNLVPSNTTYQKQAPLVPRSSALGLWGHVAPDRLSHLPPRGPGSSSSAGRHSRVTPDGAGRPAVDAGPGGCEVPPLVMDFKWFCCSSPHPRPQISLRLASGTCHQAGRESRALCVIDVGSVLDHFFPFQVETDGAFLTFSAYFYTSVNWKASTVVIRAGPPDPAARRAVQNPRLGSSLTCEWSLSPTLWPRANPNRRLPAPSPCTQRDSPCHVVKTQVLYPKDVAGDLRARTCITTRPMATKAPHSGKCLRPETDCRSVGTRHRWDRKQ